MISAPISRRDDLPEHVQVVVIGAGPAGATTAALCAAQGMQVLLVERKRFPRDKTCGGCLNHGALALLQDAGLTDHLPSSACDPVDQFRLGVGRSSLELPIKPGIAVSRADLDQALVSAAVDRGAIWSPETEAVVGAELNGAREVELKRSRCRPRRLRADVVVCAAGLSAAPLKDLPRFQAVVSSQSRYGCAATIDDPSGAFEPGVIHMAVSQSGYVGLVRMSDGRLHVAAALDRGGPASGHRCADACARILEDVSWSRPATLRSANWMGTSSMTRRLSDVADARLFVIGDSAGYVEPFTGQGMAWAVTGAIAVSNVVSEAASGWNDRLCFQWRRDYRQLIRQRQRWCRRLALGLRYPKLIQFLLPAARRRPWLLSPILKAVNEDMLHATHRA